MTVDDCRITTDAAVRARPTSRQQISAAAKLQCDGVSEEGRIDLSVRDLVHGLTDAASHEDVVAALAAMGALFRMPNVTLTDERRGNERTRGEPFLKVSSGMRRVLRSLERHPLAAALRDAREPLSLSDAELGAKGTKRPRELNEIEALGVNAGAPHEPGFKAIFFGRQGVASGLAKSVLYLSVLLASRCPMGRRRRLPVSRDMTEREREVLDLAKAGLADAKIGRALGITTRTVRFHLTNAKRKAGVKGRAQLISKSSQTD